MWTAGLTLFLMGISWGGVIYPWKSAAVISSMVIGAVLLIALFLWEGFMDLTYPAIPVKFFANRGFISLVACATVASVCCDRAPRDENSSSPDVMCVLLTNSVADVLLLGSAPLAAASTDPVHHRCHLRGLALGKYSQRIKDKNKSQS